MSDSVEPKDYLEELQELRESLKQILNKDYLQGLIALAELIDRSYVDSYCKIKENSEYGSQCGYAIKARDLFVRLQEKAISKQIEYLYKNFIEEKR